MEPKSPQQPPKESKEEKKARKKRERELKKAAKMKKLAEKAARNAAKAAKSIKNPKKKRAQINDLDVKVDYPSNLNDIIDFRRDFKKSFLPSYNPYHVEQHWYDWWVEKDFYHADPDTVISGEKEPYVIILPPPNVTGSLHLGHALTAAVQDTLIRWKKMKGYATVYLPGLDHAGIATQNVVERTLEKEGITKYQLGREEFVKKVWEWKETYGNKINTQMRRLGSALDWKRASFTMDEKRSLGVKRAFVDLRRRGLIYRANRLVNWSCKLKTAISNIETETLELKGSKKLKIPGHDGYYEFGVLVDFAYKVKDSEEEIVVSTTRLETMLGDTAVAVHSEDERYKHLVGKQLVHPFIPERKLYVITDNELVDMELGTGAVKVTPAHDHNDFQTGKRHNLEFINILNEDGTINSNGGKYKGMKRYDVRKQMTEDLKEMGLYRGKTNKEMNLATCQRSGDIVEPILVPQWYVDTKDVSLRMKKVVEDGELSIYPSSSKAVWYDFMNKQEDWCISRQLWWGHRIPAYKVKFKNGEYLMDTENQQDFMWFVEEDVETATEKVKEFLGERFQDVDCIEQDEDVLDTWFSSGMLPFTNFDWPNTDSKLFKAFFPNSVLETGQDILFFWVARMVMMSLFFLDQLPFKEVILHSMVCDEEGKKMSKSKGNVIDPLEMIDSCPLDALVAKIQNSVLPEKEKKKSIAAKKKAFPEGFTRCGADALRYGLLSYMHENKQILLNPTVVISQRNFCNKIWNAYKFIYSFLEEDFQPDFDSVDLTQLDEVDLWLLDHMNQMVTKMDEYFNHNHFGNATEVFRSFWTFQFCDFYVEYTKVVDKSPGNPKYKMKQQVIFHVLVNCLKSLHPMMPFVTEELYQKLPQYPAKQESICLETYPEPSNALTNQKAYNAFESIIALIKDIRGLISPLNLPKKNKPDLFVTFIGESDSELQTLVEKYQPFISMMTKTGNLKFVPAEEIPKECLEVASLHKLRVNAFVKGHLDFDKEIKKLQKKLKSAQNGLESVQKKMQMPDYETKTPEDVKEKNNQKEANYQTDIKTLEETIQKFSNMKN